MLKINNGKQEKFIVATMEQLMPKEHFLRDLEKYVDFSFIYKRVEHLYSHTGRPSVDPVILIKMLLLGFLFSIDSERKLIKDIEVNIAYRWFLGIDLDEPVPDHTTISQTRRRKWKGSNIFESIFTEIVQTCVDCGLVDGKLILTDSTHVKANASRDKAETVTITVETREYIKKLDEICDEEEEKLHGDKKSKRGHKPKKANKQREVIKSSTDPDSGMLSRPGKPTGFHYLNHQSTDAKSGIITDVFVTPGNVDDCIPYVGRLKYQIQKFNFPTTEVGLDRGYDFEEIHKELYDLGINVYSSLIDHQKHLTKFTPSKFLYDHENDVFICPNHCRLKYSSINRKDRKKVYRASCRDCKKCSLKSQCIGENIDSRKLFISLFKTEVDAQRANFGTARYYEIQRKRRVLCEGNFAIQKENHNLRRVRKRGNDNVTEHCLFSALALNLKRLVKHLKQKEFARVLRIF